MIFVTNVEQIMTEFQKLMEAAPNIDPLGPVKTVTRVWQPWENLASLNQPAFVIVEPSENETSGRGRQPSLQLDLKVVCFFPVDPSDEDFPPNTRVNNCIKSVRNALLPKTGKDKVNNVQSLNGLVSNVFIDGRIIKDAGIIDKQGSALIPVTVLVS